MRTRPVRRDEVWVDGCWELKTLPGNACHREGRGMPSRIQPIGTLYQPLLRELRREYQNWLADVYPAGQKLGTEPPPPPALPLFVNPYPRKCWQCGKQFYICANELHGRLNLRQGLIYCSRACKRAHARPVQRSIKKQPESDRRDARSFVPVSPASNAGEAIGSLRSARRSWHHRLWGRGTSRAGSNT
jgi:hypothetical protein